MIKERLLARAELLTVYPHTMTAFICRAATGRKVYFPPLYAGSASSLCCRIPCPPPDSGRRYLTQRAKSSANLLTPFLRSVSETDNTYYVGEPKCLCISTSDTRAKSGAVMRTTTEATRSSAAERCGSSGSEAGSSGRNSYAANPFGRRKNNLFMDLLALIASTLFSPPIVLLCCCVAAVASATHLAGGHPAFLVSVPVLRASASRVPFAHPESVSLVRLSASPPAAPPPPTRPIYSQKDVSVAADRFQSRNTRYDRAELPFGQFTKRRKWETATSFSAFFSDAEDTSGTSCPLYFVMGLLLSVTGTLVSAVGDICMRYSFIRQKANSTVAVGTSTADAARPEERPGTTPADVGTSFSLEGAHEYGAFSDSEIDAYYVNFFEESEQAAAVTTSDPAWQNGTGGTSASQQQGVPRRQQTVEGQMRSLVAQKVRQRVSCFSASMVATPRPTPFPDCLSISSLPLNNKQTLLAERLCATDAKRNAAADAAAAAVSLNSSLPPVSSLNCNSTADRGGSLSTGISECGWKSPVATPVGSTEKRCVIARDVRAAPPEAFQEARGHQASNQVVTTTAAPQTISELTATEHETVAARTSASMLRPAAAPGGIERWSCGQCSWDGYWMLGISCTCIVSPLLSIVSLSLLPANMTGFAALQIFFVVLLAHYFLGEVVHRINLGGGVLVIAGLVTLTWSTKSKPTLPDRASLYKQLLSPSAVVFEVCCSCIIFSGLLLLVLTSYFEQREGKGKDVAVEAAAQAAGGEETVSEGEEATYIVLVPKEQLRQKQQQYVGSGRLRLDDSLFASDRSYAGALAFEDRLPSHQSVPSSPEELEAPRRPTGDLNCCRTLNSRRLVANKTDKTGTLVDFPGTPDTGRTAKDNGESALPANSVRFDTLSIAGDVSERGSPSVPPGRHWTSWYVYRLSQSRNILLPMAAGVSGSIASEAPTGICSAGTEKDALTDFPGKLVTKRNRSYNSSYQRI